MRFKYKSDEATLVFGISVNKPVPDVEPTRSQLIGFKKIDLTTLVRTFEGSWQQLKATVRLSRARYSCHGPSEIKISLPEIRPVQAGHSQSFASWSSCRPSLLGAEPSLPLQSIASPEQIARMPLQDRNPDQISVHVQDRLPDISDHGNHALEWLHLLHYKQTNR